MGVLNIMDRAKEAIKPLEPVPENSGEIKWVLLESLLLDKEQILLVMDTADLMEARQAYPDTVIYFPPEVQELYPYKDDEDLLRTVNSLKKRFKGWVVPSHKKKGDRQ